MKAVWECRIGGGVDHGDLPNGADLPMRTAVAEAYFRLTGKAPDFISSGWGSKPTKAERAELTSGQ